MMISVVYYESNQYIYKEGIVTEIDLTYKKMLKIVDKLIEILIGVAFSLKISLIVLTFVQTIAMHKYARKLKKAN